MFTGISDANRINIGLLLEYRSNTIQGRNILSPFDFKSDPFKRSGLSSIAPVIKFTPIKDWGRFAVQTSFSIPLFEDEIENSIYLDQKGYTFQNRFFYDYLAPNGRVQIYSELNTEFNFGDNTASFANDSFRLTPGVFFSYFPTTNTTILGLVQHAQLFDLGGQYQPAVYRSGSGGKIPTQYRP